MQIARRKGPQFVPIKPTLVLGGGRRDLGKLIKRAGALHQRWRWQGDGGVMGKGCGEMGRESEADEGRR